MTQNSLTTRPRSLEGEFCPGRVVRDGQVAVLYSPGYGAGWYSWNNDPDMLFDPVLVELLERGDSAAAWVHCQLRYPDAYLGGFDRLTIKWVPVGAFFQITEHDGAELVKIQEDFDWIQA
jgi:hypothetical protein